VYNGKNAVNTAVARPKRTESCRGDAPHSAFIDEAAFVEPDWFNRFLRPLLMIKARRFTLITTPPLKGSFFTGFIDTIKHNQNPLFAFENHSLICDQCAAKNIGDKCVHAMGKKSLQKRKAPSRSPHSIRVSATMEVVQGVAELGKNSTVNRKERIPRGSLWRHYSRRRGILSRKNSEYCYTEGTRHSSNRRHSIHQY
jgi:hypothetical protein